MCFSEKEIENIKYMYRVKNITKKEIAKIYNKDVKEIYKILENAIPLYKDKEWLYQKYYIENLNKKEIAKLANCSYSAICVNTKKLGFKINNESYRKRKYEYVSNFFETIDTEEKAYWLGFIMADGNIEYNKSNNTKHKTSQIRLTFTLSRIDKYHLDKLSKAISSGVPVKDRTVKLKTTSKSYDMCELKIYNKNIVDDLIKLGVTPRKSTKEIFPDINKNLRKYFILGYFDGDGCFSYWKTSKDNRFSCSFSIVGGYNILNSIKEIIYEELGISCTLSNRKNENKDFYRLIATQSKAIKIMEWLYKDSNIYLIRKHEKFKEYLLCKI